VSFSSVSKADVKGAWTFTTTTGKVISGNKAYLRELKARTPATAIPIQKHTVNQENLIANLEILKLSRVDFELLVCTITRKLS
jgi:hypothetical protein